MAQTKPKRVAFEGAEYIEYDAEQPAVVRLCGAALPGSSRDGARPHSAELECQARGLDAQAITAAGGSAERALEVQYAEEAKHMLALRGFSPLSEDLGELRTQLRVADLLLSWAVLAASSSDSPEAMDVDEDNDSATRTAPTVLESVLPCDWRTRSITDPSLLRQTQLAKKELEGRVDEGYAFGRRFVSTETFVDSLERCELLEMARERDLALPEVDEAEKAAIKIPDRELVALRGPGAGKTLKQLTLRELVAEAQAHGLDVEHERDGGAKKSKRAWIDVLRVRDACRMPCSMELTYLCYCPVATRSRRHDEDPSAHAGRGAAARTPGRRHRARGGGGPAAARPGVDPQAC